VVQRKKNLSSPVGAGYEISLKVLVSASVTFINDSSRNSLSCLEAVQLQELKVKK